MSTKARVYVQSFFSDPMGYPVSVARWQPKKFDYKTFKGFVPVRYDGSYIKGLPPDQYMNDYTDVLLNNFRSIKNLVENIYTNNREVSLICWCNEERQKSYGKLFCHTILIGYLIEIVEKRIEVYYLDGRDKPIWERKEFNELIRKKRGF